jgi:Spy/CpxP family protein refolding chaperone
VKTRWRAASLLVAVFLVGLLTGAAVTAWADRAQHEGGRHDRGKGYLARLTDELELSAAQQDSVRAILDRYEPSFDSLWQETRPRFETLRAGIRSEVRTHLTNEQRMEYDALVERRRRNAAQDR